MLSLHTFNIVGGRTVKNRADFLETKNMSGLHRIRTPTSFIDIKSHIIYKNKDNYAVII